MAKIRKYEDGQILDLNKDVITSYVCGPTVYSDVHIGNIRPILTMDIFAKALRANGQELDLVHNITDIDDKIINKAEELGISEKEVSEKYTKKYKNILEELNIDSIKYMPKVTENIESMINLIQSLIEKGFAYEKDGSVYFRVNKIENYGQQHKVSKEELINEEAGIEKENDADFALWKKTDLGVTWESPWGKGRPGWHTECVAFIDDYFKGETIDIHGGGIDLRFPHHVNEDAQFQGLKDKKLSEAYSYVGHISMEDEKMSKSLGNVVLAEDFIKDNGSSVLRYALISTNYSKPLNFTENLIENSKKEIKKLENAVKKGIEKIIAQDLWGQQEIDDKYNEVINSLLNDIDTVSALTIVNELVKKVNSSNGEELVKSFNALVRSLDVLGFRVIINVSDDVINNYKKALDEKDYETSDKLRDSILVEIK